MAHKRPRTETQLPTEPKGIGVTSNVKTVMQTLDNRNYYEIPYYQRPYAWRERHVIRLIHDIQRARKTDPSSYYFLGQLILAKPPKSHLSTIIDGQQRLVTLSLIISVLRDMTHNSELDCYLQEKKSDVRDHLDANRINMRPELEPFFNKYIRKPLGIQPLLNLPEHSEEILHKDVERALWKNTKAIYGMFLEIKDINEFILYTLKNCYFLVVTAPEVEMAFRIFKIILDQGIDISKLDKLKSDFLLSLPADFEEFSSTWEEWRSKLGVTYFHNCVKMIRHYIQVTKGRYYNIVDLHKYFTSEEKSEATNFLSQYFVPCCEAYYELLNPREMMQGRPYQKIVEILNNNEHSDWQNAAVYYLAITKTKTRTFFGKMHKQPSDIKKFFEALERVHAILEMIGVPTHQRTDRYFQIVKELHDKGDQNLYRPGLLDVDQNQKQLAKVSIDMPVYANKMSRYWLIRIEDYLQKKDNIDYITSHTRAEYILPPDTKNLKYWESQGWKAQNLPDIHKIGNMVLISRRRAHFHPKMTYPQMLVEYFGFGKSETRPPFMLTQQLEMYKNWTPLDFEKRQNEFTKILSTIWKL